MIDSLNLREGLGASHHGSKRDWELPWLERTRRAVPGAFARTFGQAGSAFGAAERSGQRLQERAGPDQVRCSQPAGEGVVDRQKQRRTFIGAAVFLQVPGQVGGGPQLQ